MSLTKPSAVLALLQWLETNAFWNSDLVDVRDSPVGGTGVFWKLGPETDPDNDTLLLRIPKLAILSPKNSFLYSMLVDYVPLDPTVDFTAGMHSIVVTYIYEKSLGESSPWNAYLQTFNLDQENVPICLWAEEEKAAMFNTECELLNMLDSSELVTFFLECINFATQNELLVAIPEIFRLLQSDVSKEVDSEEFKSKLEHFGLYVQAVISRAFTVDKYLGLSLVPGADLFNHLSPILADGSVSFRENVHFVCDDGEDFCEVCGETECGHDDSSDEEEEDDEIEEEDEEVNDEIDDGEEDIEDGSELPEMEELLETDVELESSTDDEPSEEEEHSDTSDTEEIEESKEITLKDIEEMEMAGSEDDTEQEEEEASTPTLSDEEDAKETISHSPDNEELAKELAEGSKCCDIVLTSMPSKEFNYELFNTYGNDLSNAYLLQRYGFICKGNVNVSCLLSVPMFAYLKKQKKSDKRKAQLGHKLDWYEQVGFPLLNEIIASSSGHDHDHAGHDHGEDSDCEDNCEDGCCDENEHEAPESWQLSPKVQYDGTPTEQTVALVRLINMPFAVFYHKLVRATSERKMAARLARYLLEDDVTEKEKSLMRRWVEERLARYKDAQAEGRRGEMIRAMVEEEKAVLQRALEVLA